MKLQSSKKHKTNKAYNFYNSPLPSGRLNQFVNNLLTTAKYFDSGHCVYTFVSPKRKTNEKRQHQSRSNKKGSSLYHHTFIYCCCDQFLISIRSLLSSIFQRASQALFLFLKNQDLNLFQRN